MTPFLKTSAIACITLMIACGGGPTSSGPPASATASFEAIADLHIAAQFVPSHWYQFMTLHRYERSDLPDGQQQLVAGLSFGALGVSQLRRDGDGWALVDPFTLKDPCPTALLQLDIKTLTLHEGETGDVVGEMSGDMSGVIDEDILVSGSFTAPFAGGPDRSGPMSTSNSCFGAAETQPQSFPGFALTEPVSAAATGRIVGDDGQSLPLRAEAQGSFATIFAAPNKALAFGRTYRMELAPFVDLAGNAGDLTGATVATPGLDFAAEDGFEGDTPAALVVRASIVSAPDVLVLKGTRSVQIEPGGSLSVRLSVQAGDTVVRALLAANLADYQAMAIMKGAAGLADLTGRFHVAAPYGEKQEHAAPIPAVPLQPLPEQRFLSAPVEVTIPLPPGVTDEVMLVLEASWFEIVIDDLRVE